MTSVVSAPISWPCLILMSFPCSASFAHLSHRRGRSSASVSSGSASAAAASRTLHREPDVKYQTSEDEITDDDVDELPAEGGETSEDDHDEHRPLPGAASQGEPSFRSPSSLSSHMRYRTPMAGSTFSPPPVVPAMQPLPGFTTPSAYGGTASPAAVPSSASVSTFLAAGSYPPSGTTYPAHLAHSSAGPSTRSLHQLKFLNAIPQRHPLNMLSPGYTDPRPPIERAVESVQAHIAALAERVEMLESMTGRRLQTGHSSSSLLPLASSRSFLGGPRAGRVWDPAQMGLWSLIITPLTRIVDTLRTLAYFLAYVPAEDEHEHAQDPRHRLYARGRHLPASSPVLLAVRRLFLDASFVLAVLGFANWMWRKTGLRRKEVYVALGVLWRALVGSDATPRIGRQMVERGV